jgi:hypothetical protein
VAWLRVQFPLRIHGLTSFIRRIRAKPFCNAVKGSNPFQTLKKINSMLPPPNFEQKTLLLAFENCPEEKVPELLSKLRPLLFSFCLKHKCFYSLYTRSVLKNKYSFGFSFYSFEPNKSAELELAVIKVFVNPFSKESAIFGSVNCLHFVKGFSRFFEPVKMLNHVQIRVKTPAKITAVDFCFSLIEKFEFNVVTFEPESKRFSIKNGAYCIQQDKGTGLLLLVQNDATFAGVNVLNFIAEHPQVYGAVSYYNFVLNKK